MVNVDNFKLIWGYEPQSDEHGLWCFAKTEYSTGADLQVTDTFYEATKTALVYFGDNDTLYLLP